MSSMMNFAIPGRATSIETFVRVYEECGIESTSMEIVVYPFSHKDGPSPPPGTITVDANGRNRRHAHRRCRQD